MFAFAPPRTARKPALTPLIDVVFLLLVFFMLASEFGRETTVDMAKAGGSDTYSGPPRLITFLPDRLLLNGVPQSENDLPRALKALTTSPDDTIVLRAQDGANVQRLIEVAQHLKDLGYSNLVVVE